MGSILDDRHPPSKFHGKFSWFRSFCETCWQSIRRGWQVNTTFLLEGVTCTSASSGFYISCLICLWRKHKGRKASLKMFFFSPERRCLLWLGAQFLSLVSGQAITLPPPAPRSRRLYDSSKIELPLSRTELNRWCGGVLLEHKVAASSTNQSFIYPTCYLT